MRIAAAPGRALFSFFFGRAYNGAEAEIAKAARVAADPVARVVRCEEKFSAARRRSLLRSKQEGTLENKLPQT